MQDLSGSTTLLISVYMPSQCGPSSHCEYLNTLGEIEGFIVSQQFDNIVLVGDFNVDFDRGGSSADLLLDFMTDLNVVACDLSHRNSIGFTYERDDGIVRSWIDHIIICSQSLCPSITNVHTSKSGTNLSDHLPLFFNLEISFSAISDPLPPSSFKTTFIDWSKVSQSHIASYQDLLSKNLLDFPSECLDCFEPDCSIHKSLIDNYSVHISSTLLCCASRSFPCFTPSSKKMVG